MGDTRQARLLSTLTQSQMTLRGKHLTVCSEPPSAEWERPEDGLERGPPRRRPGPPAHEDAGPEVRLFTPGRLRAPAPPPAGGFRQNWEQS